MKKVNKDKIDYFLGYRGKGQPLDLTHAEEEVPEDPEPDTPKVRSCRHCGCTDADCSGCIERTGEPCHWVSADECSACKPEPGFVFHSGTKDRAVAYSDDLIDTEMKKVNKDKIDYFLGYRGKGQPLDLTHAEEEVPEDPEPDTPKVRSCRHCGCTDADCSGCIERTGEPCHWVSADECSACKPEPGFVFHSGTKDRAVAYSDDLINTYMKTGIELIAEERNKQITKHGFTAEHHREHDEWYENFQLQSAAFSLLSHEFYEQAETDENVPEGWDAEWFNDLNRRSREERLIIAGALIAAELDRIIK